MTVLWMMTASICLASCGGDNTDSDVIGGVIEGNNDNNTTELTEKDFIEPFLKKDASLKEIQEYMAKQSTFVLDTLIKYEGQLYYATYTDKSKKYTMSYQFMDNKLFMAWIGICDCEDVNKVIDFFNRKYNISIEKNDEDPVAGINSYVCQQIDNRRIALIIVDYFKTKNVSICYGFISG